MQMIATRIKSIELDSAQLKWIACITMLIDHTAIVFFDNMQLLRIIGRLAFPLFAYQLIIGREKTHDKSMYYVRLVALALVSQLPYVLLFGKGLNIIFTFLMALFCIEAYEKNKVLGVVVTLLALPLSNILNVSYGLYGVVMVFLFYLYRNSEKLGVTAHVLNNINYMFGVGRFSIQVYSLASLLFISLHNGEKGSGKTFKYLYWFYPAHLGFLYGLNYLFLYLF